MYHKVIQDEMDRLNLVLNYLKRNQPSMDVVDGFLALIGEKVIRVFMCNDDPRVEFCPEGLDDIKRCLKYFGGHRYFIANVYEVPENGYKVWQLKNKDTGLRIDMSAYFYKAGQSCRYIQTSVKEVPVMELQCS